jgi:hypothetical protein
MKLWFWVKVTIAAFMVYGLAAYHAFSQAPGVKACQAKYAVTIDQLTTAAADMSVVAEPGRRKGVIELAAKVQHSYDLLVADPAHSAPICDAARLAELDSVTGFLRHAGYLPDQGELATLQARVSDRLLRDGIARFRVLFPPGTVSPDFAAEERNGQKRATGPRSD